MTSLIKYKPPVALIIQLGIIVFFLTLHLGQLHYFDPKPLNWSAGERLSTTADAYYFLRMTDDYLSGAYDTKDSLRNAPRLSPTPPLIIMTAWIHKATGMPVERISFFIATLLGTLLIPVVWAWARRLMPNNYLGPIIACLASASSFAFYRRVMVGRFDTDSLNLILIWLLLFWVARFISPPRTKKPSTLIAIILTSLAIYFWWPQGGQALSGIGLIVYVMSFVLPSSQLEKIIKISGLGVGLLLVILVVGKMANWFQIDWGHSLEVLVRHLELVFARQNAEFFNVASTIDELVPPTLWQAAVSLSGSIFVLLISLVGLTCLFHDNREYLLYLGIPVITFTVLSLSGRRFLMFLVPAVSLGLGYFWFKISHYTSRKNKGIYALVILLGILSVAPAAKISLSYPLAPSFDAQTLLLASTIDDATPEDSMIWNWWGPGYMLQHTGKRRTVVDGGIQSPQKLYIAAVPLAMGDVSVARFWIRFFAKHPGGLNSLNQHIQNKRKTIEFLFKVFKNPEQLPGLVTEYKLPPQKWKKYLFPDSKVTLVLFSDMLVKSTWLSIGRSLPGQQKKDIPVYAMPFSECSFDLAHGKISYRDKILDYSAIYQVTPKQLSNAPGEPGGQVAIAIPDADKLFYMDTDKFDCLTFRLLFVNPRNTPGYKLIAFNPFIGGIWEIE